MLRWVDPGRTCGSTWFRSRIIAERGGTGAEPSRAGVAASDNVTCDAHSMRRARASPRFAILRISGWKYSDAYRHCRMDKALGKNSC